MKYTYRKYNDCIYRYPEDGSSGQLMLKHNWMPSETALEIINRSDEVSEQEAYQIAIKIGMTSSEFFSSNGI
jgi:hypothetical protein